MHKDWKQSGRTNLFVLLETPIDSARARTSKAKVLEFKPASQSSPSVELLFERAWNLEEHGYTNKAIATYLEVIKVDPKAVGAMLNLGTIYFHGREWTKAMEYYSRTLEIEPNYALGHYNMGNLADELGNWDLACSGYKKALELSPGYLDCHYNYAWLNQRMGKVMTAIKHWRIYLRLAGNGDTWAATARRELQKLKCAINATPPKPVSSEQVDSSLSKPSAS